MIQMASVFGEQGQQIVRERGFRRVGTGAAAGGKARAAKGSSQGGGGHRDAPKAGYGILKIVKVVGCGSGTTQRVKREIAPEFAKVGRTVWSDGQPNQLAVADRQTRKAVPPRNRAQATATQDAGGFQMPRSCIIATCFSITSRL
jgi:hypothetical protein